MNGWKRLEDGMDDPEVGGPELSRQRKQALADVLELMGCHCLKSADCEHVDVAYRLVSASTATAIAVFADAIRTLPRPISMRAVDEMAGRFGVVKLLSANPEHRREHR